MKNKNSRRETYKINELFFNEWSPNMAYILGFTSADGNIFKKTLAWELSSNSNSNFDLLKSFNNAMESTYPIENRKQSFRLRISNPFILEKVKNLGITPNKSKTLSYIFIPDKYQSHFLRGFLDGDGWIAIRLRKNGRKEVSVGFCGGSLKFMKGLTNCLNSYLQLENFNLRKRIKITKKGKTSFWYQLEFYSVNANKILDFLYGSLNEKDLFLKRKLERFIEAKSIFREKENYKLLGKKIFNIKKNFNEDPYQLIKRSLENNMIPKEIALKLGISLSTIYRLMHKYKIRIFVKRGSKEWSQRIIKSKMRVLDNGQ